MKYQDIPTFNQRCNLGADDHADIQRKLLEEIADLRHFIELRLVQPHWLDFTKVRTITADGRCLGWDGNEINTAA